MPNENSPLIPAETAISSTQKRKNMLWTLGCIYGATAVGFGAFGAHGLKRVISDPARLANWSTAAQYQLVHSLALLLAASSSSSSSRSPSPPEGNRLAGNLFTAGMTMFSGSIYALTLNPSLKFLGPVTPLGGLCLIGGWVALAF
ncbi:hypothetical protein F4778DRAFT_654096 [Xylariomycetidae sp. FL2044]|nr:hypothetical protein F4778DRAFT_654096 [Xylariomycetidae sp. FL2044]